MFELSTTYQPFKYPQAEAYRIMSEQGHWMVEEVEMGGDINDYNRASPEEKRHIANLLTMFTQSDFNVANGYLPLISAIKNNEIRGMLTSFMGREYTHQQGYGHLPNALAFSEAFNMEFLEHKETLEKDILMKDDTKSNGCFGRRLAKGILLEGISLFGSFVMLKNFERFGKYSGTCTINEWSLRDESLHVEGNSWLFRTWCNEGHGVINDDFKKYIYKLCRRIVEVECKFIDFAFADYQPKDLTADQVKEYIKHIADRRLIQLGLKANYGVKDNPLPWMDKLSSGASLTNFFEKRVTDYAVAGMVGEFTY